MIQPFVALLQMERRMKLDIHTHIMPESLPDMKQVTNFIQYLYCSFYFIRLKKSGYGGWLSIKHTGKGQADMLNDDGSLFRAVQENSSVNSRE